ncbi:MAG TPA: hypothetical protein VGP93_08010 [Polyangiaceae bacterium]|nr:hypothetical protein [Polyangiaceae bacterium]
MELSDIQGLVFFGYGKQPRARYYLLRFGPESVPREWLSRLVHRVSSADSGERGESVRLNLAFSASGLAWLGLDEQTMFTFPREFTQGMAHPERNIALGDFGESAPEHWQYGGPDRPIDALLMVYARTPGELGRRHDELSAALERHGIEYMTQDCYRPDDGREHFGFLDGLSNPVVKGGPIKPDKNPFDPAIKPGELVLGYKNAYGRLPLSPRAPLKRSTRDLPPRCDGGKAIDLGYNGSYLVLRKLEQDVAGFWNFAEEQARKAGVPDPQSWARFFAARLVGRWPNGTPLVDSPAHEAEPADLNGFGYRERDQQGLRCPLGAHVRRTNPRDALGEDGQESLERAARHRIMRRGRLYLEGEGGIEKRGLLFMALNSNLRRQFEFVQQTWVNNSKFAGLCSDRDPLIGRAGFDLEGEVLPRVFTRAFMPVRQRCVGLPSFVSVRGGGYFFLPSLRALAYLAEG